MSGEGTPSSAEIRADNALAELWLSRWPGEGTSSSAAIRADNEITQSRGEGTPSRKKQRGISGSGWDEVSALIADTEGDAARKEPMSHRAEKLMKETAEEIKRLQKKWCSLHREFDDIDQDMGPINEELELIIPHACSEAIDFILKNYKYHELMPETAYLAVLYLTKYVSIADFDASDHSKIRLITIASLLLASYGEENEFQPSDFCANTQSFSGQEVRDMIVRILHEIQWGSSIQNPFKFTPIFVELFSLNNWKVPQPKIKHILLRLLIEDVDRKCKRASIGTLAAIIYLVAEKEQRTPPQVLLTCDFVKEAIALGLNDIMDVKQVLEVIQDLPEMVIP